MDLVTYYLAANYPDRFSKCIVVDAPAEVDEGILDQIRPGLARLEHSYPSWNDYLTMVKAMPYYEGWWDPALEAFYRSDVVELPGGEVRSKINPAHIVECVEDVLAVDFVELARSSSAADVAPAGARAIWPTWVSGAGS